MTCQADIASKLLKRRKAMLGMLQEHPGYDRMVEALKALGVDGMSDIEDSECETSYTWRIKGLEWRSHAVTMWLHSLDSYDYDAALAQHSVCIRDRRGGRRFARVAGGCLQAASERHAVPKLHSSAYLKAWLDSLDEGRRYCLEINNQGFDFSFPIPKYPYRTPQSSRAN
jgi:hypothetical protein